MEVDDNVPLEEKFPLVSVPDETLTLEQRKIKRMQQMQLARVLKRRERDELKVQEV